jgi:hypothetical protein
LFGCYAGEWRDGIVEGVMNVGQRREGICIVSNGRTIQ